MKFETAYEKVCELVDDFEKHLVLRKLKWVT